MNPHRTRRLLPALTVLLLPACESGPSLTPVAGSEKTEVRLLGGGFCEFEGHRIPIERYILTMRMRLRAGADDARQRSRVRIWVDPTAGGSTRADLDKVLDELTAMGVGQIQYL